MPIAVYNQIKASFSNPHLQLLEQLCRGKPEIIIQDLLFTSLQGHFGPARVKKEWGYRCHVTPFGVRKIDIVVLHEGSGEIASSGDVICCIELKHYSANQGRLKRLLYGGINRNGKQQRFHLDEDFRKCRPCVPLIQIGIFTTIVAISPLVPAAAFPAYPFIDTHVLQRNGLARCPNNLAAAQGDFAGWLANQALNRYTTPSNPAQMSDLIFGHTQSFRTASGVQVTGSVNYFIGLTKLFPEKFPCSEAGAKINDRADMREF